MMIHIEPLGTDVFLPAFLIGYELPLPGHNTDRLNDLPRWVVTIDQQAGGMCMRHPSVVGAVLRLEANRQKAKKEVSHLIKGLKYMAEDPKVDMLKRDYPVLGRMVATRGADYDKRQLRDLENVLSSYFWTPPLYSGFEAFIRCAACDPLDFFKGWRMMGVELQSGRVGSACALDEEHCYYVEQGNLNDLALTDEDEFNEAANDILVAIGRQCNKPTGPDVFFLWENCD